MDDFFIPVHQVFYLKSLFIGLLFAFLFITCIMCFFIWNDEEVRTRVYFATRNFRRHQMYEMEEMAGETTSTQTTQTLIV